MHFSSKGEYGLRALVDLATHGTEAPVRAAEVAERQSIPLNYLEQLLGILKRAGIVTSIRGPKGGFALARDASEVTVEEVLVSMEGEMLPQECVAHDCPEGADKASVCAVRKVWGKVAMAVRSVLSGLTLKQLADDQRSLDASSSLYHI
jgi:Rrf2 family protein